MCSTDRDADLSDFIEVTYAVSPEMAHCFAAGPVEVEFTAG